MGGAGGAFFAGGEGRGEAKGVKGGGEWLAGGFVVLIGVGGGGWSAGGFTRARDAFDDGGSSAGGVSARSTALRCLALFPPGLEVRVPDVLQDEHHVDEDVVPGDNHLPRGLVREQRAEEVRGVSQAPFDQEENREPGCGLQVVVFDDLGELGEQPGEDAETAQKGREERERRGYAGVEVGGEAGKEVVLWCAVVREGGRESGGREPRCHVSSRLYTTLLLGYHSNILPSLCSAVSNNLFCKGFDDLLSDLPG